MGINALEISSSLSVTRLTKINLWKEFQRKNILLSVESFFIRRDNKWIVRETDKVELCMEIHITGLYEDKNAKAFPFRGFTM